MTINDKDPVNGGSQGVPATGELNSLRMKLGKKPEDLEPSREQLIATEELDEEPEGGTEEEVPEPPSVVPPTAVTKVSEADLSIRKQVRKRLLEGASRDDLLAEGFNKSTISTVASEVKKELGSRRPVGIQAPKSSPGMAIFAHGSPPEAIIESIDMPDVADGKGEAFEQGTKFGMSLVILGVRVAQELSGIGVAQAKPIVDMAKTMREGEALAAKNAAGDAAMEAAGMVEQAIMPILANIQKSGGGGEGGDPVKAMMVRTMEPIMQRLMGSMLGRLAPGTQPLQITEGKGKIEGWTRKSE